MQIRCPYVSCVGKSLIGAVLAFGTVFYRFHYGLCALTGFFLISVPMGRFCIAPFGAFYLFPFSTN